MTTAQCCFRRHCRTALNPPFVSFWNLVGTVGPDGLPKSTRDAIFLVLPPSRTEIVAYTSANNSLRYNIFICSLLPYELSAANPESVNEHRLKSLSSLSEWLESNPSVHWAQYYQLEHSNPRLKRQCPILWFSY